MSATWTYSARKSHSRYMIMSAVQGFRIYVSLSFLYYHYVDYHYAVVRQCWFVTHFFYKILFVLEHYIVKYRLTAFCHKNRQKKNYLLFGTKWSRPQLYFWIIKKEPGGFVPKTLLYAKAHKQITWKNKHKLCSDVQIIYYLQML